jgi:tetratricopeptide (TPR) repeat protein
VNTEAAAAANQAGLEAFAQADPAQAERLLAQAYRLWASELGILVNLGLALMQQGRPELAERCYQLARRSNDPRVRRSACKNLGFLHLWRGEWQQGWHWHGHRFEGERFLASQWRGEPLHGRPLLVWNDVGMGDAFQFVRYTKPLLERGERVVLAVQASQVAVFSQELAWPLEAVVDREQVNLEAGPHIPLMSLIGLLDPSTAWGRHWPGPTWRLPEAAERRHLGLCWASNPGDRSLHRYKSLRPEQLLQRCGNAEQALPRLSLQTDEAEAHQRLGLMPPQRCWISTLALAGRCQRIHSVDTAVAHLAAGAGIPMRLHLAANADWRWQTPGPHWYPSLELA